jgi:hypothetical protein
MCVVVRACLIIPAKELIYPPIFALRVGRGGKPWKKLRKSRRCSVRALEQAGIQFIDADESGGEAVRLRRR